MAAVTLTPSWSNTSPIFFAATRGSLIFAHLVPEQYVGHFRQHR